MSMLRTTYNVIVILGPTASGKSKLGVQLAKKFGGVVISADSRQVYRGMDIGTAKITTKQMFGVPHFLLDVASPHRQYSVSRYVKDVNKVLRHIDSSVPIFLVGGSPFYIKAVTQSGSFSDVPPNPKLRRWLARFVTARLIARLQSLDPARAKTIDPANRRRLIRAIEIASTKKTHKSPALPSMKVIKIGITVPKQKLSKNIDRRVDQRLKQGMVAEVRRLHDQELSWKRLDAFGLEYRYVSRYLRGQLSRPEMVQQLKSANHDFVKRQMTWWKREHDIFWVRQVSEAEKIIKQEMKLNTKSQITKYK